MGLPPGHCALCKVPLNIASTHSACNECRTNPPSYDDCLVITTYEFPASTLIYRLKFASERFIARLLGKLIASQRADHVEALPEVLCCIPMHHNKLREKRYNHAQEIARHTAIILDIPLIPSLLVKTKQTESQRTLSRSDRFRNLRNSIDVSKDQQIHGKHIAVIDDVMTTGATFDYVARLLKAHGASRVEVWAFARTPKPGTAKA